VGVQETSISPGVDGLYADLVVDQTLLSDGGELTVTAAGGEVEAFEIAGMTVPYSLGFQPGLAPTAASSIAMSAGDGYTLQWGGIEASDTMLIKLTSTIADGDGAIRRIECSISAGAGSVTFTPDALNLMPQGEALFESFSERSATETAGDYEIEVIARVVTRVGDDAASDWARGAVTIGP
jgi:hypothetical protein